MPTCNNRVSAITYQMPSLRDRMSTYKDTMPGDIISLSSRTYSVYRSRYGLPTGRDFMSGRGYEVSACSDKVSSGSD